MWMGPKNGAYTLDTVVRSVAPVSPGRESTGTWPRVWMPYGSRVTMSSVNSARSGLPNVPRCTNATCPGSKLFSSRCIAVQANRYSYSGTTRQPGAPYSGTGGMPAIGSSARHTQTRPYRSCEATMVSPPLAGDGDPGDWGIRFVFPAASHSQPWDGQTRWQFAIQPRDNGASPG